MPKTIRILLMMSLAMIAPTTLVACGDDSGGDADAGGDGDSGDGDSGDGDSGDGDSGDGDGDSGDGDASADCDIEADLPEEEIPNPTGDTTLTSDKVWLLGAGTTYVADGETLTIEPCTKIIGNESDSTLVVSRGGTLMAEGTADAPILFTSPLAAGDRAAGDWGGVILLGKAPNFKGTDIGIEGLIPADAPENSYGGDDAADNSGKLAYVRIEFGGVDLGGGNEVNGLTMGSVGSGTEIHHIEVNTTLDDCFEWFGGAVDADHLVCNNGGDDMFDADQGFKGTLTHLFGRQVNNLSSDPNGFEMDSDLGGTDEPRTDVTVSKATLCGTGSTGADTTRAMVLRENLIGEMDDIVATGFDFAVDTRDDFGTPADPSVVLTNAQFFGFSVSDWQDESTDPADDNDNGFVEADWFDMGSGNSMPDPAPFTVADCQADGGPNATVTGSDAGAFAGEADWLDGAWVSFDVE